MGAVLGTGEPSTKDVGRKGTIRVVAHAPGVDRLPGAPGCGIRGGEDRAGVVIRLAEAFCLAADGKREYDLLSGCRH